MRSYQVASLILSLSTILVAGPVADQQAAALKKAKNAIISDKKTAASQSATPEQQQNAKQDLPRQYDVVENVANSDKNNPDMRSTVAKLYIEVDEAGRAVPHAQANSDLIQSMGPGHEKELNEAQDLEAQAYYLSGDKKKALRKAQQVLDRDPKDEIASRVRAYSKDRTGPGLATPPKSPWTSKAPDEGGPGANPSGGADRPAPNPLGSQLQSNSHTRDVQPFLDNADAASRIGDKEKALAELNRGLAKFPKDARLLNGRAMAELDGKQGAAALDDAKAAVESNPNYGLALQTQARAIVASGGPLDKALDVLKQAYKIDPKMLPVYQEMVIKLTEGNYGLSTDSDRQIDANDIGTAGRRGLGFNPQRARDQLFSSVPERYRGLVFPSIIVAIIGLIAVITAWLGRLSQRNLE